MSLIESLRAMAGDTKAPPLAVTVVCILLVYYLFRVAKTRNGKTTSIPTAPAGLFEVFRVMGGPDAPWFILRMAEVTNSNIFRINLPVSSGGTFVIGDHKLGREILLNPKSQKPAMLYSAFTYLVGAPSVFTRPTDAKWTYLRKGAAPAFSSREVSRMNRICKKHVERWIQERMEPLAASGGTFDPAEEMTCLTFGGIMESGMEYSSSTEEFHAFIHHLEIALREFTFKSATNPFRKIFGVFIPEVRRARQSGKELQKIGKSILEAYRANPKKSDSNTLIKLIEQNPHLSEVEKIAEIVIYLIAGTDTAGFTLSNTLVLVAKHPEVQTKIHESMVGADSAMTDYLRFVKTESQRLLPVTAMGSVRETGRDFVLENGDQIPKGAWAIIPQLLMNRDPTIFMNPTKFEPERWENATKAMNLALSPFSLGIRNCIGQSLAVAELHSVLPVMFQNYQFKLDEEGELDYFLTLKYSGSRLKVSRLA